MSLPGYLRLLKWEFNCSISHLLFLWLQKLMVAKCYSLVGEPNKILGKQCWSFGSIKRHLYKEPSNTYSCAVGCSIIFVVSREQTYIYFPIGSYVNSHVLLWRPSLISDQYKKKLHL